MSRKKVVTILTVIGCAGSLLFTCGMSSYLVGVVDSFINQFAILLLVAIQCVIFGWYYGAEKLIPILNEKSIIKVGSTWVTVIKYVLPILIMIMWIIGIVNLFMSSSSFEIMVDVLIMVVVLVLSIIFYRTKAASK